MKELYALVDDHIQQYEQGTIAISDDIEFSMRDTVKQITHYILSRYLGGQTDPRTGARKPFRNIGNAIVDIEWRAKNIDRKSIEAHATDGDFVFSLVNQKELHQWMKVNNFGETIDAFQRKESEYGSVLLKKTETADELIIEPVNWSTMIVDPRDIENGVKIDRNYLTPLELKAKRGVWTEQYEGEDAIDAVLTAAKRAYKSQKGENRIEVLDIEGQFEARCIYPDEYEADDDAGDKIGLYSVILAVVRDKKYCLYKAKLKTSRYKHKARKAVEGRDMGLGVWEEVFEPQIWTNEAVIDEREALNLAGKVIIKTNKKNVPSALSLVNGEIIDLDANEYFESVQLRPSALPEFQNVVDAWFINTQRDQSAFPAVTGEESKAGVPFAAQALQAAQGGSIFNKRRDSDGFFLGEIIVDWIMPFIIKQIQQEHVLSAAYSKKELELIDRSIREYLSNKAAKDSILGGTPFYQEDKAAVELGVQAELDKQGDKRTLKIPKSWITLDKVKKKIRFDITDEMVDDQRRLNALATTLQAMAPTDPARQAIIEEMMEISGISPASFGIGAAAAPAAAASPAPTKPTKVSEVLPAGQQ